MVNFFYAYVLACSPTKSHIDAEWYLLFDTYTTIIIENITTSTQNKWSRNHCLVFKKKLFIRLNVCLFEVFWIHLNHRLKNKEHSEKIFCLISFTFVFVLVSFVLLHLRDYPLNHLWHIILGDCAFIFL